MTKNKSSKSSTVVQKDADSGAATTTVDSWVISLKGKAALYSGLHFPPGLFDVKSVAYGNAGIVCLFQGGRLAGWDPHVGPGGHTALHKYLETLRNVARVKCTEVTDTCPWTKPKSVYVWHENGQCELHFSSGGDNLSVGLGHDVLDVIPGNQWIPYDFIIRRDHTIEAVLIDIGADGRCRLIGFETLPELRNTRGIKELDFEIEAHKNVSDFVSKLNDQKHLANPRQIFLSMMQDNISLVWLTSDGDMLEASMSGQDGMLSVRKVASEVAAVARCSLDPGCYPFIILKNGRLFSLNDGGKTAALPPGTAFDKIKEPVIALKDIDPNMGRAIALTESGRALFVTAHEQSVFKPDYRGYYSSRNYSPDSHHILDAVCIDSLTVIVIRKAGALEKTEFMRCGPSLADAMSGNLILWGKGRSSTGDIDVTHAEGIKGFGPVLDAQIYRQSGYDTGLGWMAVKPDGALFGLYESKAIVSTVPSWFPNDFRGVEIVNGIAAIRSDGRKVIWGPTDLCGGEPVKLEELAEYPDLPPPAEISNLTKLVCFKEAGLALAIVEGKPAFQSFLENYKEVKKRDAVFYAVSRGKSLLEQSIGWWDDATWDPGPRAGKQGPTSRSRGLQWRLCMAWAGFEIWIKGLLGPNGKLDMTTLSKLSRDFGGFEPLSFQKPPGASFKAWIEEEGGDAVLDYLGVNKTDRETLRSLLLEGAPVTTWAGAVLTARALRNATVHGSLSPTKVEEWKLETVFTNLPSTLKNFADKALEAYTNNGSSGFSV